MEDFVKINTLDDFDFSGRTVLFRPDINSPLDPKTKRIANINRLEKAALTLRELLEKGAKVALIAHQGDTLDYQNLIPLEEHAAILERMTGHPVAYSDDVCGPAAVQAVKKLKKGEAVVLGNLRYLSEEVTAFEKEVKLEPKGMFDTWLVRSLTPVVDFYVNDAFAAAHRNCPSMVAFQELLPTSGGRQLIAEYTALSKVTAHPAHPCVFVLGGGKISDAFGMMRNVLESGTADKILTAGITGLVMALADGIDLGHATMKFLEDRDLIGFIEEARQLLSAWGDKFMYPEDLAYEQDGKRQETSVSSLSPLSPELKDKLFPDIGQRTIEKYQRELSMSATIFVNGPAGVYEDERWALGTQEIWQAIASSPGYTVVGGGDTINAASRFTDLQDFSYVCTAGGAMVRFLAGKKLPLIVAMEKAYVPPEVLETVRKTLG
ncbi:phosphoglycerate kinase [Parasphaerochaeta coccoides]|uniref:Phosphoglycerate kinase n=1 Tax=Parasphaerochaeta coccoides (strain ATCC BAA-1237 / DSM 17374 / SPN1) TaxID=760011 RepID=F4GJ34_PARC1|nr:phosphoglycerate kinase [Parasphaerochaeta coccoides]AEC01329.1 phosphoglycerate kinase [Parasphaerochaeta coccoides DSM 17374]